MTVGVSHSFGGDVVLMDMQTGQRWDITPDEADEAAAVCDGHVKLDTPAIVKLYTIDHRTLLYAASVEQMIKMAKDLRHHAGEARKKRGDT